MAAQRTRCSMDETKQWLFRVTIRSEIVLRTDIRRDRLHVASKDAYLLQNWQQVGRQVDCHSWPHCSDLHDVGPYDPSHCRCCRHTLHTDHPQPSLQSTNHNTRNDNEFCHANPLSFHSSSAEESSLLECDAALGVWFQTHEGSLSYSEFRVKLSKATPKMNHSPNNTTLHPWRPESSWFSWLSMYST